MATDAALTVDLPVRWADPDGQRLVRVVGGSPTTDQPFIGITTSSGAGRQLAAALLVAPRQGHSPWEGERFTQVMPYLGNVSISPLIRPVQQAEYVSNCRNAENQARYAPEQQEDTQSNIFGNDGCRRRSTREQQ
jgi:hypothetical protein